jgi:nucleotide-binding universal stress UspA family protein
MARIVVGVDGSEGADAALRWASRLALATDAEVVVVHVVDPSTYEVRPLGLPRPVLNEADWRDEIRAELEGVWCGPLRNAGVRHRVRVEEGHHPGHCLVDLAEQECADMLVTGHRGLGALAELVRGSVSAYAAHHSRCPVAIVPVEPRAA